MVGKKPIHLMKEDDRKRVPQLKDLHIDIGAKDGDEARGLVRVGDVAVIDAEPIELPNDRFISRSMDNRIGCFVALEAARLVAEAGGAPGDVYALAVTQEEITFGGARTTAFSLNPDVAIAVDVTFATDQPGISEQEVGRHRFGSGPGAHARLDAGPDDLRAAARDRRGREHPVHRDRVRARHGHRRRRLPHRARRHPERGRLGPAALHALAGGDGPARRHRQHGEADRGLRAAARARHRPQALKPLLLLFDIDGTLLQKASVEHALALREAAGELHGVDLTDGVVDYAGRTDLAIARDLLSGAGVAEMARGLGGRPPRAPTSGCARRTCRAFVAPGIAELLEALSARPDEFRLSLVTGNLEPVARLKLDRAGVGRYFEAGQGGFGSDHEDRGQAARDRPRARLRSRLAA